MTGLQSQYAVSAVELLLADPALMDNLRKAHMGNYGVILSLLGCLDHGATAKRLADRVIDACRFLSVTHILILLIYIPKPKKGDHVVSLREEIFTNRIRYSTTSLDEQSREAFLDKAVKSLEK